MEIPQKQKQRSQVIMRIKILDKVKILKNALDVQIVEKVKKKDNETLVFS